MSLKQHADALLEGFETPQFPACLRALAAVISMSHGPELSGIVGEIPGFQACKTNVNTSDGYSWYRAMYFQVDGGIICVTTP